MSPESASPFRWTSCGDALTAAASEPCPGQSWNRRLPGAGEARRVSMTRLDINTARGEALFSSALQESDALTATSVAAASRSTRRRFRGGGCHRPEAQEFGDHPEAAGERMRWARHVVSELFAEPAPQWARPRGQPIAGAARHAA